VLTNLETAQVLFQVFVLCGADIFQCNVVDFSSCHDMAIKIPFYHIFDTLLIFRTSLVIHEKFGDGIMSAIDFTLDVEKEENPAGDRVKLVMSGKFLPYKKW